MSRHFVPWVLATAVGLSVSAPPARAQAPTIETGLPPLPGGNQPMLGASPGSGASGFEGGPGTNQGVLGGRAGTSTSRAPATIATPGTAATSATGRQRIAAPEALPTADLPVYGSLDFPTVIDDPGPSDGLTLDGAIERLVRENLYLKAAAFELPQAEADVLTASLRANPVFYADSQLIPYGQYSQARPGGQTQYDVNISWPLDLSRKRQARTTVAVRAKRVLEQQYRDAVRLQIDNLYTVYVDALASRATLRYSQASVEGLDRILVPVKSKFDQGAINEADYLRVVLQRETADIGRRDSEEQVRKTKRSLANLLNIPPDQVDSLELHSSIRDTAPLAPPEETLIQIALESRPDLIAYRLGVCRAEADVTLAKRNRYQDVYVLMQPYTFQDNEPIGRKSATSWALGVTVPIPIFNRNQGNIQRAQLNVGQTQTQLAGQIRQIYTDVQQAEREYLVTRESAERFETVLAPHARTILAVAQKRYTQGEESLIVFLGARNEYVAIVKLNLDTLIRHRRAMLDVNTAVGRRILP